MSNTQSRIENLAKKNTIKIIRDGKTTKYCLRGREERIKLKEINIEIKKLEQAKVEKIVEERQAELLQIEIKELTEKKNSISIFNIKKKKELQSEIEELTLDYSKLVSIAVQKREEINSEIDKRISLFLEEKHTIEDSMKK